VSIEPAIRTHIAAAITPTPIYANRAPDGITGDYVVQRLIGKQDGVMGTSTARIQWDIFGSTYAAVKTIAVAVEAAMRTFNGGNTFALYRGNEIETYESETNQHRVILDAVLRFDERPTFSS
jgi:hypothetical protein